jgi:hypothetical protein
MKPFARPMLLAAALLAAQAALARGPVPIVERPSEPIITGSGKTVNGEAFKRAIMNAGAALKWEVAAGDDGKSLRATYRVRNKHVVTVDIVAGPDSFAVKYADSVNMNYGIQNGAPVIHPSYNQWVGQLVDSIRVELKKF